MGTAAIPRAGQRTRRRAILAVGAAAVLVLAASLWQAGATGEAEGDQGPGVSQPVRQRRLTLAELCGQERSGGRPCAPSGGG